MWFSVSHQFAVILYASIVGVILGILYDCVRLSRILSGVGCYSKVSAALYCKSLPLIRDGRNRLRRKIKAGAASNAFVFAGDIIYAVICAAVYSVFLFHANNGQVRWYFILASGIGFFIYYFTVSKFILTVLEAALFFVKAIIRYVSEIVLLPFRLLWKLVHKIWKYAAKRIISPLLRRCSVRRMINYTEKIQKKLPEMIRFPDGTRNGDRG